MKTSHHISIRLECKDRPGLLRAAQAVLTHFGSHLESMAFEEHVLVAWLTPLDTKLFKPHEGFMFVVETVRLCFPYDYVEIIYRNYKRYIWRK